MTKQGYDENRLWINMIIPVLIQVALLKDKAFLPKIIAQRVIDFK